MADRYQTQCPHCGVKFQITAQQLQLANGTVRCGSCLQVFQATHNMVALPDGATAAPAPTARPSARPSAMQPPADAQSTVLRPAISVPPPKPAAPPRPTAPPPPPGPTVLPDDDLVDQILRELDVAPAAAKPAMPKAPAVAAPKTPAAPPDWTPPKQPATPAADKSGGWGAPPPAKAPPKQPAAPSGAARHGIDESRNNLKITVGEQLDGKLNTDDPFGVQATTLDDKDFRPEADESWAKDMLGERPLDEREERLRKFQISADELKMADTGVQHTSGLAARIQQMAGSETPAAEMPSPIRRTAPAGGSQVDDEFDFLVDPGLTMQDVELPGMEEEDSGDQLVAAAQAHQVRWHNDVFWGTLSVVMLLVLLGQYMAANRDTLARDPGWRGFYEVACGAIGCVLPGDSDVRRIQGANLVVRSHPDAGNALVVDAVIYNRAAFAQPFPRLELGFSDAQGNPVAGRVFTPAEYLKGELAESKVMPPDTPIHLSLDIIDPGPGAVNYELRFLAPEAASPDAS